MDKFKYAIMLEILDKSPSNIDIEDFRDACLTFSQEDLDEIFTILTSRATWPVDDANAVMRLLQVIWNYR